MALQTDHFVNQAFWGSKWSPTEQLVKGFYSLMDKIVWKNRLILSKARLIFFNNLLGNSFISKELALKEPLDDVMLHSGNYCDIQMALETNHFVDRTFWGSNWRPSEQLVKDWWLIFYCPHLPFVFSWFFGIIYPSHRLLVP